MYIGKRNTPYDLNGIHIVIMEKKEEMCVKIFYILENDQ